MQRIIAIDPGTLKSGVVIWDGETIIEKEIVDNDQIFNFLDRTGNKETDLLVIEKIASYGMAVGETTFETVYWTGRMAQYWLTLGGEVVRIPRKQVALHHCHSARAKDSNIWRVLKDRFGELGTKKNPGFLYGIREHMQAALALAVFYYDNYQFGLPKEKAEE